MIRYRVTTIVQRDGNDYATAQTFSERGTAGRYAAECRIEDPSAVVAVVALNDRGEVVPDRALPARTAGSDAAKDRVMAMARGLEIVKSAARLDDEQYMGSHRPPRGEMNGVAGTNPEAYR